MDLHNRHISLLKGGNIDENIQSQLDAELHNRIDQVLKYRVDHEQPHLQPSHRQIPMDSLRMLSEQQSIEPELETINAYIRTQQVPTTANGGIIRPLMFRKEIPKNQPYRSATKNLYNHDDFVNGRGMPFNPSGPAFTKKKKLKKY